MGYLRVSHYLIYHKYINVHFSTWSHKHIVPNHFQSYILDYSFWSDREILKFALHMLIFDWALYIFDQVQTLF